MNCLFAVLLACFVGFSHANYCHVGGDHDGIPIEQSSWQDMEDACTQSILDQIQRELNASLTYLSMGAHFTQDRHFRPGTAAFFLKSANEERQHAKDIMSYLLLRGKSVLNSAIPKMVPTLRWESIEQALSVALEIEKSVRQNFLDIIKVCEGEDPNRPTNNNDYHAADLMTGVFLQEQHESIRHIAGHLATLVKMKTQYGEFAELMFDKSMLQ